MNRISWLSLIACLFLIGSTGNAQEQPKVDLFVGYSSLKFKPTFDTNRTSLNGWNSNIAAEVLFKIMSVEADFSGHYGKLNGRGVQLHTAMFGPRFAYHGKRWGFFAHNLYGVATISGQSNVLTPLIGVKDASGFAFVPGIGGIEVKINERLAYRIVQFDLVYTRLGNEHQMQPRFLTGLSFHFGTVK
jgi:hypothetical protein